MTDDRLALAWQHLCDGSFREAEALFREILLHQPDDPGAWRLLGEACLCQQRHEDAAAAYRQASERVALEPEDLNNLGVSLVALGRYSEAEEAYRAALAARPGYARSFHNLAVAYTKQRRYPEAAGCFREALKIDPGGARSLDGLADALLSAGEFEQLSRLLEESDGGGLDPAVIERVRGLVHGARNQWDEAIGRHRRALELRPDYAEAACDLGKSLLAVDRLDEAVECLRDGLARHPGSPELWNNLGCAQIRRGELAESRASFETALQLRPAFADAHVNLAHALLQVGDYARGWVEYEWRWKGSDLVNRTTRPLWDGGPVPMGTLLLVAEQGLGDTLQFIRYAAIARQRVASVILACQKPLIPLLRSCAGIDRILPLGEQPGDFDAYAPLLSLPRILGTTLETVPAPIPYVHPRADLLEAWRRELRPLGRFLVGVAWQGSPGYGNDRLRSFRLAELEPVARIPGVTLVSLQKGPGAEQAGELGGRFRVVDFSDRIDRDSGPFMDSAAIIKNLDLVIACDSAVAHLSGALGVSVWIAHTAACDWRWLVGREDSPWYPGTRLFHQARLGDWQGVFSRMAEALAERLASLPMVSSVPIEVAPGELLDRITILEIKRERIRDPSKLRNVARELDLLGRTRDRWMPRSAELAPLVGELKAVNEAIWEVEDHLRDCESRHEFGPRFIELARSVYRNNDRRAAIKRKINERLGSSIVEEKGYRAYERGGAGAA